MVAAHTLHGMEGYLTLPQLAARLGLKSTGGLRTQIMRGVLKAEKFGNMWVVTEAEAARFVRAHRSKPGPEPGGMQTEKGTSE